MKIAFITLVVLLIVGAVILVAGFNLSAVPDRVAGKRGS